MPLRTETIDLDAEVERLSEEMEDAAETQVDYPIDSDGAQQAAQRGQRAERFRSGVRWAMREQNAESVQFSALTNGERHRVRDTVEGSPYKSSDCYVAAGTADAFYLAHEANAVTQNAFEDTVANITDLHPAFVDWAESKIHDLSRMEPDEGKSYQALVQESRNRED